jgi:hypothetical protein
LQHKASRAFSQSMLLCEKTVQKNREFHTAEFCDVVWLCVVKTIFRQGTALKEHG